MSEHRLLIATDVPYWNRSTGAEQRIAALVDFLVNKSIVVNTFFIGNLPESDRQRIREQELEVIQGSSDQPPSDRHKKIGWHLQATLFRFRQLIKQHRAADKSEPLKLADYHWPWAIDQFADCVHKFGPDSILIEYATLAYLLSGLTQEVRQRVKCLVDSHDVLHLRDQQFREHGYSHWLSISREEEAEVLQLFDVILAIQNSEAEVFRKLAPDSKTIVVGHSLERQAQDICLREPGPSFVIGYIGSRNHSNLSAIAEFVKAARSELLFEDAAPIELRVAGDICPWLAKELGQQLPAMPNVKLLGRIEDLNEFYSMIDVAINPVTFGTGLKIKNCEALSYGCPLITTPAGRQGLPAELGRSVFVVESPREMVDKIRKLAHTPQETTQLRRQLSNDAKVLFSDHSAYSELYRTLISSNPNQIP